MPSDKISVTVKCGRCGTVLEWPDDAIDSTKISCSNCGDDAGTYGDLKREATAAISAKIEGMFKDAFKRR